MRKAKVLIIDDERGFTEMVKLNLEVTGRYRVFIENDSALALDTVIRTQPDIILLDVIMPCREGPDVVFQLRNHPLSRDVPVIFLTATITKEEAASGGGGWWGDIFLSPNLPPWRN
ncbi:MAG TPA: response regulator [Candidatus Omnitrophota bacterium]|nr:response regulator [Candidatus Omnitrophota bacterium]HPB68464.1 response regulator [Candidatus Omnitrophota bacterium]HQO58171.1 response regulator [Candidatus Omnitrophota bacterium]